MNNNIGNKEQHKNDLKTDQKIMKNESWNPLQMQES